MSKTRIELVNEALKNLVIVGAGQEPDTEDFDEVDAKVDGLLAQLRVDEICFVANDDEIPDEWFDPIAELLANNCASKFGQQYSLDKKTVFEQLLRRLTASRTTYQPMQSEYF